MLPRIVSVRFDPSHGHEQKGTRPALVITPKTYNQKSGLVGVCPITQQIKGYPFEVMVQASKTTGVVLVDQLRFIDWSVRRLNKLDCDTKRALPEVRRKLTMLLQDGS